MRSSQRKLVQLEKQNDPPTDSRTRQENSEESFAFKAHTVIQAHSSAALIICILPFKVNAGT